MGKIFPLTLLAVVLWLAGCSNKQPGYDTAYRSCQELAYYNMGPKPVRGAQKQYIEDCLRSRGFEP